MRLCLHLCAWLWLGPLVLHAAEHRGRVEFGGLPVPGATVTAIRDAQRFVTVTDEHGVYSFSGLADGAWTIRIEMLCFSTLTRDVVVAADTPDSKWELQLLPLSEIRAAAVAAPTGGKRQEQTDVHASAATAPAGPAPKSDPAPPDNDAAESAADGFLVNGSVNNGASSPFAQASAFGNRRQGSQGMLTGGLGVMFENSALDARAFSLTGQDTPKPAYNHVQAVASLGGVLKIPHVLRNGPVFFIGYQWTRNRDATTQPGVMPDALMRNGDFSQALTPSGAPVHIFDPRTGVPFPDNRIPADAISPQARALLKLYPLPNFTGGAGYNYQLPIVDAVHQDTLQSRLNKTVDNRNQLWGSFAFQSARTSTPNLFGFLDTADLTGTNISINWQHMFRPRLYGTLGYQFSRMGQRTVPYFADSVNVSHAAGVSGNNQDPMNWGPPNLSFAGGITPLSEPPAASNHNQTSALSYSMWWSHIGHNVTFGGDYRRLQFNYLSQQDPRGTFAFTGAAAGSDFADFLLGIPDTSSIAFGNADKYLRASSSDAYITDDWRVRPQLTVNAGLRWEYGSPIHEQYGRLVNLDVAPGFSQVAPVVASDPIGPLTGQRYPDSLVRPDRHALQPRAGIAWRPVSGSSLVIRAGYGVEYNTSVYPSLAIQMAQQPPLSKSLSVSNTPANPLTLADGFKAAPAAVSNTFAIDPRFRIGYAQNWKASIQREFPGSLIVTATYLGIKGTRGMQEFLPNTIPAGAADPCPACPRGFAYLASNGNSTRESGQIQVRRRLHNGVSAAATYTFSKSIDDSALGGKGQGAYVIAQNWLDLRAERGLSNFDQRHLLNLQMQYTTGMGLGGGALAGGWRGALLKEWTLATQVNAGSGLPLTPVYFAAVNGTGITGSIRPDYTGAPLYAAPSGLFLNPAAYSAPAAGQWGDAGRNSITGPSQLVLNASLGRSFRWKDRFHIDLRFDAANALNHVSFASWNVIVTGSQFGLPTAANAMRNIETSLRVRF